MNYDELFIDSNNLPKSLSLTEINDLFKKKAMGDNEAREKLISHNIKLVIYTIMKKFNKPNYDKRELISIGMIGLIKAVDSFDMTKNYTFSTYASKCICNQIYRHFEKNYKYEKEKNLSEHAGILDNDLTVNDLLADETDIIYDYEQKECYKIIRNIVNELPLKEKDIVSMYFGFDGYNRHTIKQIAQKYNTTLTTICTTLNKTKYKIKQQLYLEYQIEPHKTKKIIL